jgi:predicted transcriptional regulator
MSLKSKDSINIITPVLVKSIVTEDMINSINIRISSSLENLNDKLLQIEYQKEFYKVQSKQGQEVSNQTIESIKKAESDIKSQIKKIEDQAKQVSTWELGQEVIVTQRESLKTFSLGSNFSDTKASEIVVKDGIIIEIRE